jgi:hypothetical protein
MITPMFIQIIFWIAVGVSVIAGLYQMTNRMFLPGLFMLILGPIAARIYCEILIVIFKIHENVEEINRKK